MLKSLVWTGWHIVQTVAHPLQVMSLEGFVSPDHGDERPDGYSSTLNFHICNAYVWTMIGSRPDG